MLDWLSRDFPHGDLQPIVEPTSTYHHPLVRALTAWELAYTLINPARTAAFARVQGKRAKTDRGDTRVLASLGRVNSRNPVPRRKRIRRSSKS